MAADTFSDIWRLVRLHASDAPFALVRAWTQQAYEDLCERRPWVWTVKETRLQITAARAVTVNLVTGSPTITSSGAFLATDVGMQFRIGTYPIYTIIEVADANNAVLDQPYADTAGNGQLGQILSAYVTLPPDFGAFLLVVDLILRRQIGWWFTQEDLAGLDPTRIVMGDFQRALVPTTVSPVPAQLGQARSEWWPYPTPTRELPAWYRARPQRLNDTDPFQGVLGTRGKALVPGAMKHCAMWPGTTDKKNPHFNLGLAKMYADEFDRECATLELRDDDQWQRSWVALPYHRWPTWGLSGDTTTLRASDATVRDYF